MRRALRRIAVVALVVLAGCSDGEGSGGSGGGVGAACTNGSNCADGLFCFVASQDTQGSCMDPPAACGGDLNCSCLDELRTQCASGFICEGRLGDYVAGCDQGTLSQEGEECSEVVECETGLYCWIPVYGQPGTCVVNPVECGASPSCDCFQSIRDTCSGAGSGCSVRGELARVVCY